MGGGGGGKNICNVSHRLQGLDLTVGVRVRISILLMENISMWKAEVSHSRKYPCLQLKSMGRWGGGGLIIFFFLMKKIFSWKREVFSKRKKPCLQLKRGGGGGGGVEGVEWG